MTSDAPRMEPKEPIKYNKIRLEEQESCPTWIMPPAKGIDLSKVKIGESYAAIVEYEAEANRQMCEIMCKLRSEMQGREVERVESENVARS